MNHKASRRIRLAFGFSCIVAAASGLALRVHADAASEIARLAKAMEWKAGAVVGDIGAGDGQYSFAAAEVVGAAGKVFATEIDEEKLKTLRAEVKSRNLQNVVVVESAEATTNLPDACCDAIFLRRVYHHITKPLEFDASMLRSLKAGGKLAIIDFPPHPEYGKVKGVPKDREDHGIRQKILIDELTKAGFALDKVVDGWPTGDYCVLFIKK